MTIGDIIEKFLGVFGVAPGPQRKLMKRIEAVRAKIVEMEESRNDILRTNTVIIQRIDDLKRKLQQETNRQNQDLIMDQIDELDKELNRNKDKAQQMGENITAQRVIRGKSEQLLEQLRHGADPIEIEMLMEKVEDMTDKRTEAVGKVEQLDKMGRRVRKDDEAKDEDAARAARMAAILGKTPAAPAPAKREPAAAAAPAKETAPAGLAATPAPATPVTTETPMVSAG